LLIELFSLGCFAEQELIYGANDGEIENIYLKAARRVVDNMKSYDNWTGDGTLSV